MRSVKFYLVLISAFTFLNVSGQDLDVDFQTTGFESVKMKNALFESEMLYADDDNIYYLIPPYEYVYDEKNWFFTKKVQIYKYDTDLNLLMRNSISLKGIHRKARFRKCFQYNGEAYIITSYVERRKRKEVFMLHKVNLETLELESKRRVLFRKSTPKRKYYADVNPEIHISEDCSRLLILLVNKDAKRSNKAEAYLYDQDFNKLKKIKFKFTCEFHKKNKVYEIADVHFLKNSVFLLTHQRKVNWKDYWDTSIIGEVQFKNPWNKYTYQVYQVDEDKDEIISYDIKHNDYFIKSMNIKPLDDGRILCAGIYTSNEKFSALGAFSFVFNTQTKNKSDHSQKEFSVKDREINFYNHAYDDFKENFEDRDEWDPYNYKVGDINMLPDGSYYFSAERYVQFFAYITYNPDVYVRRYFREMRGSIIHVGLQNDFAIKNIVKVNKLQIATGDFDYWSSYFVFEQNNSVYYLFPSKHEPPDQIKKLSRSASLYMSMVTDGEIQSDRSFFKEYKYHKAFHHICREAVQTPSGDIFYLQQLRRGRGYVINKITVR